MNLKAYDLGIEGDFHWTVDCDLLPDGTVTGELQLSGRRWKLGMSVVVPFEQHLLILGAENRQKP